jgi:hypothetical protein
MTQPASSGSDKETSAGTERRPGGCHCGRVRFEVDVDLRSPGSRCNCSVCTKTAVTSYIVKPATFRTLAGEDALGEYEWGSKTSKRYFCAHCGVHTFGRGHLAEVGGDYVAVNANCLDDVDPTTLDVIYWDGRHNNWQAGPRKEPWPIG